MSDVLSQLEIDSLLSALSSGEIDAEELKENEEK
ncbi:MAG TPA: flagellar motor switch protein FliM, partial [Clostridiales bacterium]|nr:flagellar motor switch protein FliM [Clostridiales bacterium]